MSIADKFQTLLNNLRTDNHESVSSRYSTITKRLNKDFWDSESELKHSRYVGSYGRGTEIKGFSDVDILFELPNSYYWKYKEYTSNGPSALLQAVKNSLQKTYPSSSIGGDGQVVVINFNDNVTFEILPAFINKDKVSYTHPDSNNGGSWKTCNPVAEINAINEINNNYSAKVKHLVRMMKAWKEKNNAPMKSILLESLAMQFIENWEHNDKSYLYYDFMARDFLKFLSDQDENQAYWLIKGSNRRINRTGKFEYKAKISYNKACEAINDEENYSTLAKQAWQEIFGNYYEG